MAKALIINGNVKKNSRLTGVQQYIEQYFENANIKTEAILVHELPAEDLITANFSSKEIAKANAAVAESELLFILTPIFKASYSGVLKTYLDLIPQKGLENKTVVPIAIGGSIGHLLAIEYALKPVLSVLGATTISNTVFILDQLVEVLENGKYRMHDTALERLNKELQQLPIHQFI